MRLVIAEDSALFRNGLAGLPKDAGHEVVAAVPDAESAMYAVREGRPDAAIVDVRWPPGNKGVGAVAAVELRQEFPTPGIVLLSRRIETRHAGTLAVAGHFGYLLKDRVLDVNECPGAGAGRGNRP